MHPGTGVGVIDEVEHLIEAEFKLKRGEFGLNASFHDGGITILTGENGTGKSTFLNALAGFVPVDSGTIMLNGRDITSMEIQRRNIVHITPNSYIGNLSVEKHIAFPGKPDADTGLIGELKESFGIDFRGKVGNLSMGQKIRVALATAFYRKPEALLIDEALSNLSYAKEVFAEITRLSGSLKTDVIIVAHSLADMQGEHLYVMENGSMRRSY